MGYSSNQTKEVRVHWVERLRSLVLSLQLTQPSGLNQGEVVQTPWVGRGLIGEKTVRRTVVVEVSLFFP
jgi:hypothetical protein